MSRVFPIPEFCWTVRRMRWWQRCRRGYFYYYYGSFGGHDESSPRRVRELYLAKCALPLKAYCRYVLAQAFRRQFYAPLDSEIPPPAATLWETSFALMRRDFEMFLSGRGVPRLLIADWLDREVSPGEKWELCEAALRCHCAAWDELAQKLLTDIPPECRVFVPTPLRVQIGELATALAPLVAYRSSGVLMLWESTGSAADGALIAALGKFAAAQQWNLVPGAVRSCILNSAGKLEVLDDSGGISPALRRIRDSVSEMVAAIRADGSVDEADFSCSSTECENCRFVHLCRG